MSSHFWVIFIAAMASITGIVQLAGSFSARQRKVRVESTTRALGLVVTPDVEQLIGDRVVGRMRAGAIGGLIAIVAVSVFIFFGTTDSEFPAAVVAVIPAYGVGLSVGIAVAAFVFERRRSSGGLRVARLKPVTLTDFAPAWLWIVLLAVVVVELTVAAILSFAGGLQLKAHEPRTFDLTVSAVAICMIVAGAIAAIIAFGLSMGVARKATSAASPNELAWDDALRGVAIQDSLGAPIMLTMVGVALALVTLGNYRGNLAGSVIGATIAALVALGIVSLTLYLRNRPQQQYLRRLWPQLIVPTTGAIATSKAV